jgi:glycosyltransferase involved in cell wall biosynthesis
MEFAAAGMSGHVEVTQAGHPTSLRVVLLGPYPPPHGGVEVHVVALQRFLRERGHHVSVINITRHRKADSDGVYYPGSALGLVQRLRALQPDIVHLHVGGIFPTRVVALALVCTILARRRSVFTFHSGGYPTSPEGRRAAWFTLRGFVLRRFGRVIGVNQPLIDLFRTFGVSADKLRLIEPHAVRPPAAGDSAPADVIAQFRARHDPFLLSVSGLEPEYDIPTLVRAFTQVRKAYPMAGLAVVGSGGQEAALRAHVADEEEGSHVELTGDLPHAHVLDAIAHADVLLRTTLYDGDSIAVREALHLGTPVVATDTGHRPPGVRLAPIGNADAIAAQALAALETRSPARDRAACPEGDDRNLVRVLEAYVD